MADEPSTTADPSGTQEPARTEPTAKTFTQEQVDELVEKRLGRQRSQFKDYDELKQKAQKLDDLEESRKSEADKLLGAIERANQAAQAASEREKAATERANATLIRAAVVGEASRQQAIDPDAVYALLDKSQLTIGDGDQVSGVEDAVKGLLEERSYLAGGRPAPSGFDGGARDTAPAGSTNAAFNDLLRRQAGYA